MPYFQYQGIALKGLCTAVPSNQVDIAAYGERFGEEAFGIVGGNADADERGGHGAEDGGRKWRVEGVKVEAGGRRWTVDRRRRTEGGRRRCDRR